MASVPLMRVNAPYLLSLGGILLRLRGTADPGGGLAYEDERCEIRGPEDLSALTVRMKAHGPDIPDMVVAARSPEGETIEARHVLLAAHVEGSVARCFEGERVFRFLVESADGTRSRPDVHAADLRDAKDLFLGDDGMRLLGILAAPTPAEFAAQAEAGAPAIATDRIARAAAHAARVEAARGLPDEVYRFTARDTLAGGDGSPMRARPIQALSLADAEAAFRLMRPEPTVRILRIEIGTLLEYVEAGGERAAPTVPSPAVAARDGVSC